MLVLCSCNYRFFHEVLTELNIAMLEFVTIKRRDRTYAAIQIDSQTDRDRQIVEETKRDMYGKKKVKINK